MTPSDTNHGSSMLSGDINDVSAMAIVLARARSIKLRWCHYQEAGG